jgi:hypothetical protein
MRRRRKVLDINAKLKEQLTKNLVCGASVKIIQVILKVKLCIIMQKRGVEH